MNKKMNMLCIESSAMGKEGQSARLAKRMLEGFVANNMLADMIKRDLNDSLPHIDNDWVVANSTLDAERSDAQNQILSLSDSLIAEIENADVLVIGVPLYNFAIPASLKAWIDLICRARKTFAYGENGPEGLMTGKKAIIIFSSGGTPFGSDTDFASDYMRHILKFIGIFDCEFIVADQHFMVTDALQKAQDMADALVTKLKSNL